MPANLDARLAYKQSFIVWVPLNGVHRLEKRVWLGQHGEGTYFPSIPQGMTIEDNKEEWLFSDPATAMHFKIKFG